MNDQALASEVERAGGRVFIGFKDPAARTGVNERGRVLISESAIASAKTALRVLGIEIEREYALMPSVVARISATRVGELRQNSSVEYIEPIFPGERASQDTAWHVTRVNAHNAWSSSAGSGAKLLVIDSGADTSHSDLSYASIQGCDGSNGLRNGDDHGTMVAGVAAALNNSVMTIGVSYGAALWSSKDGDESPDPSYTACGVEHGRVNSVDVINISSAWTTAYTALTDQINAAYYEDDIVFVAAAGNNAGAVRYPAWLASVVAVSATTDANTLVSFSAYGAQVLVAAPGVDVLTTCPGDSLCVVNGTSFSAPHVAGAVAILRAYNGAWSAPEIRRRLAVGAYDLGASGRDNSFGYGLLNVYASLTASAPSPPSISINGPVAVKPFATCAREAEVSGGVSPFSFSWLGLSSSQVLEYQNGSNHGESFTLFLTVTGADLAQSATSMNVSVSNSAPECVS